MKINSFTHTRTNNNPNNPCDNMNCIFAILLLTLQTNVLAFSNNCVPSRGITSLNYRKSRSINDSSIPNLAITKKVTVVEASLVEEIQQPPKDGFVEGILSSYIGPRFILAAVALLYGTNFSLGALMNENLPASAATSGRMVLASIVLSPFLLQLKPSLRRQVLMCGAFVSLGYVTQVSTFIFCKRHLTNAYLDVALQL